MFGEFVISSGEWQSDISPTVGVTAAKRGRRPPRKLERLNNIEGRGVSGRAASGAVFVADVCHKILSFATTEPERAPLKAFYSTNLLFVGLWGCRVLLMAVLTQFSAFDEIVTCIVAHLFLPHPDDAPATPTPTTSTKGWDLIGH